MFFFFQILRGTCFECHRLVVKSYQLCQLKCQLKALEYGDLDLVYKIIELINELKYEAGGEDALDEIEANRLMEQMLEKGIAGKGIAVFVPINRHRQLRLQACWAHFDI